jgi:hypothetical protein
MIMNEEISKIHNNLDKMIQKYKDNDYVFGRLANYIENLLPTALENATELQKQREDRRNQLTANRDEFTSRFLKNNRYFYSSQTELFLHYDGLHFVIHSEDDIQHQILSTISTEKCLREWKHKVNKNIIKRIKERSPLNAIPESATIQFVINNLCPLIFPTRNHAKYFLTIIGECLSSKNVQSETAIPYIYILNPVLKEIIREISNQCYTYLGLANIFSNLKFKYYDHNYNNCRLLAIDKIYGVYGRKKLTVPPVLSKYMLDFLCVASHYAARYGNADLFLNICNDTRLVDHSLFLSKNTPDSMVDTFIDKSLTQCAAASTIDSKNIIFLWKKFLQERSIPNIIFYDALKIILKNKLKYDESADCFTGVTSVHLPIVSQFLKFWENTIMDCTEDNDPIEANELEIDEICFLFKGWSNLNKNISDTLVLDLIQYFYPDSVIESNKYVLNVKCKLWNKRAEVINAVNLFKEKNVDAEIYTFYCAQNKTSLNVSKRYFDKNVTCLQTDL